MTKRTTLALAAALLASSSAFAGQSDGTATIDMMYNSCIRADCSLPDQLALMDEMTAEIRKTLNNIRQECEQQNYAACVGPQHADTKKWYKLHGQMASLMRRMEMKSAQALSAKEGKDGKGGGKAAEQPAQDAGPLSTAKAD